MSNALVKPILWGRGSSTNVQKVLWALTELQIDHDWIEVGGTLGGTDTAEFKFLNPNKTVPVWQSRDLVLWESQAILRHLARSQGRLYGRTERDRANIDRWLDWFALLYWPPARSLFLRVFRDKTLRRDDPEAQDAVRQLQRSLDVLSEKISTDGYLAAEQFDIADIAVVIGLNRTLGMDLDLDLSPSLKKWFAAHRERSAFRLAVQREPDLPGHRAESVT